MQLSLVSEHLMTQLEPGVPCHFTPLPPASFLFLLPLSQKGATFPGDQRLNIQLVQAFGILVQLHSNSEIQGRGVKCAVGFPLEVSCVLINRLYLSQAHCSLAGGRIKIWGLPVAFKVVITLHLPGSILVRPHCSGPWGPWVCGNVKSRVDLPFPQRMDLAI